MSTRFLQFNLSLLHMTLDLPQNTTLLENHEEHLYAEIPTKVTLLDKSHFWGFHNLTSNDLI